MTDPPESAELLLLVERAARSAGCTATAVEVLSQRPGRLVARVRGPGEDGDVVVKVDAASGAFAAEATANAVLRGGGVPVNDLLAVDDGPPSVLVARWVEGPAVTAASPPSVLAGVGRALAAVHALPARPPYSGNPTLVAWIDGWVRTALEWWAERPSTAPGHVEGLRAWWVQVQPLVAGRVGVTMLLDGRPEHLIATADPSGGPGRVGAVRIVDVADAQAGDPVMDLAVLELHEPGILRGVLPTWSGARVGPGVGAEHLERLVPFYVLLRALAAAEWHGRVAEDRAQEERWLAVAQRQLEQRLSARRPSRPASAAGA